VSVLVLPTSANRLQMNPTKIQYLSACSKHNITMLGSCAPALQLGTELRTASDHVSVLGRSDYLSDTQIWLSRSTFRRPVQLVYSGCANFVTSGGHSTKDWQAFVTSRIDYCNGIYAGAPKTITDKLQRVLNVAARVVIDTRKFDRGLSTLLHDKLHWLEVPERVTFKLGLMTYRCLHGQAPRYLAN